MDGLLVSLGVSIFILLSSQTRLIRVTFLSLQGGTRHAHILVSVWQCIYFVLPVEEYTAFFRAHAFEDCQVELECLVVMQSDTCVDSLSHGGRLSCRGLSCTRLRLTDNESQPPRAVFIGSAPIAYGQFDILLATSIIFLMVTILEHETSEALIPGCHAIMRSCGDLSTIGSRTLTGVFRLSSKIIMLDWLV
ncbi:hypothetical protein VNO77_43964 [Canavalia gladiata]|uniref:Uncharacterized protein n=1 Tax=Canavalia gladiata TaxID=3824 RepID=A0AAN9PQI9_CANGL